MSFLKFKICSKFALSYLFSIYPTSLAISFSIITLLVLDNKTYSITWFTCMSNYCYNWNKDSIIISVHIGWVNQIYSSKFKIKLIISELALYAIVKQDKISPISVTSVTNPRILNWYFKSVWYSASFDIWKTWLFKSRSRDLTYLSFSIIFI